MASFDEGIVASGQKSMALPLLLVCLTAIASAEDYCSICEDHTVCQYTGVASSCRKGVSGSGVESEHEKTIVDFHNSLRDKVAAGKEGRGRPGPQPKASDMKQLSWDAELAKVAQRWADQCKFQHDSCRRVDRFSVGQNLALQSSSPCPQPPDLSADWKQAIQGWYDEVAGLDNAQVGKYSGPKGLGHYTQLVWGKTALIGCGFRVYEDGGQCQKLYVCNYGEAGNTIGHPIYKRSK